MAQVHSQVLGGRAGALKGVKVLAITVPQAAMAVDQNIFVADQAYQIVSVEEVHAVVGGSSAVVTVAKCTGTQAPDAGATVLGAVFDLTTTVNTVVAGTLHTTLARTQLAEGDRLALDFGGTIDSLAGVALTIVLIPLAATGGDTGDRRYRFSDA